MSNIVIVDDSNSCLEFMETGDYVVGLTCENEAIKIFKNDDIDYFEIRYSKNGTSALRMVWRLLKEVKILKSQKNWWNMFVVLKEQDI